MNPKLLFSIAAFVAVLTTHAEDLPPLSSEDLAKATPLLMAANARLGELPLKLELAPERAMGLKAGEGGLIFIPDRRLESGKSDKADKKKNKGVAIAVGQLWTSKLSPKEKDVVLPNDKLRLVKVPAKDKERELAVYSLGIEKSGKKAFQLALYGKDNSPVLRVPLTAAKAKGAAAATLAGRKTGEDGGVVELNLLGRFKAEIPFGRQLE